MVYVTFYDGLLKLVVSSTQSLWKFRVGGNFPVDLPMVAGSACKTFLRHLETRAGNVWDLVQSDQ